MGRWVDGFYRSVNVLNGSTILPIRIILSISLKDIDVFREVDVV